MAKEVDDACKSAVSDSVQTVFYCGSLLVKAMVYKRMGLHQQHDELVSAAIQNAEAIAAREAENEVGS